jgi:eukaryotic-like serine/threonine-protein kinase
MAEPANPQGDETVDLRLAEILDGYCRDAGRGLDPDPQATLNSHPEVADGLTACLEGLAAMEELRAALGGQEPAPPPPRVLGDYELLEELGRGGMGVVYRARQVSLDRPVALKMVRAADGASVSEVQRFRNEAAIVARLDHPNIVPVYEVGEHDGRLYYSMKLIEGGSLAAHLDRFRADPRAAARLMVTVAQAVHHAHQRGILHRDLKPSNILLDPSGQPHVTDFGLAKRITTDSELTLSGALVGTPCYMAPEQTSGHKGLVTTATDVYGLGGILYTLLTGRPPCEGETLVETLDRVRDCEPSPPGAVNRLVDRDLETVCLKCLRKEPAERYGSAEALARDLERWLAGEPIKARPVGRLGRLGRWCRRHPALAGAVVAAVALALAVTVKAVSVARDRSARLEEEVLRSNLYAAQGVASTALWQLERLSAPVVETAESPELRGLLARGDRKGLRRFFAAVQLQRFFARVKRKYDDPGRGLARPGGVSAFETWYVLDSAGRMGALAPTPGDPTILGRDFSGRDYFRGALRHGGERGRASVHVSRVFHAENLGLYKFAISAPVRAGGGPKAPVLGVVAATITTASTLGALQLNDERHTAVLVGRRDTNPPRGPAPAAEAQEYLILLHPAYRRGDEAVALPAERLRAVPGAHSGDEFRLPDPRQALRPEQAMDARYEDPVGARDPRYAGRWLAGFAPVGDTEFVVIVQQRYGDVVDVDQRLFLDLLMWGGGAVLLGLLGVGAIFWYGVRRAVRPATPG